MYCLSLKWEVSHSVRALLGVEGQGVFVVVVLPVLVDFGGFVGAIFSCFLTSEVRTILGWLSLTGPVIFNTKMKTERSYKF